eukprot:scaffold649297_cov43-Prasinocladus_malaysianus.AAC.1
MSVYNVHMDVKDRVLQLSLTSRDYNRPPSPPHDTQSSSKRGRVQPSASIEHVLRLPDDVDASRIHWSFRGN